MSEAMMTQHPALLVMDVQRSTVERFDGELKVVERIGAAISAARAAAIPVIYVTIWFRPGYPEMSARTRGAAAGRLAASPLTEGSPAVEIYPSVAPLAGEIVVAKRRVSAFAGSDLELVLRAQGLDSLVLCGIATSGVVLSTLRQAADLDYQLSVLSDACADNDAEVQRVLLEKIFPRQATVLPVAAWCQSISRE